MGEFYTSHQAVDPLHAIQAMSDIPTFPAAFHAEPASVAKAPCGRAFLSLPKSTSPSPRPRPPRPGNASRSRSVRPQKPSKMGENTVHVADYLYRYYDPLTGRWPNCDPLGEFTFIENFKRDFSNESYSVFQKMSQTSKNLILLGDESEEHPTVDGVFKLLDFRTHNLYLYVDNESIGSIDFLGLTLYVCLMPTIGGNGTHAFLHWQINKKDYKQWGMHGCSGTEIGKGKTDGGGPIFPGFTNCTKVNLPKGASEKEVFNKLKSWKGWHKGIWFPWLNDCHGQLENAFEATNTPWPNLPGGRLNWPGGCCNPKKN